MKRITFSLLIITIITLISATILEKLHGTPWVASNIYGTTWFLLLWAALSITALIYIIQRRLYRRPITLLLHLSFIIILIGAAITHYFGINGQIHLRLSEEPKNTFVDTNYQERQLPFFLSLEEFQIIHYPGTTNPMDFVSHIQISDTRHEIQDTLPNCPPELGGRERSSEGVCHSSLYKLSMNKILKHRNYRFYQSSYDTDHQGTILSIYHDPYGITITYIGYTLLFLSMTLFLLNKLLTLKKEK